MIMWGYRLDLQYTGQILFGLGDIIIMPKGTGGHTEVIPKLGVEIIQLGIAYHAGNNGDFLSGIDDQPLGLQHSISGQIFGVFHSCILHEDTADIFAAHV